MLDLETYFGRDTTPWQIEITLVFALEFPQLLDGRHDAVALNLFFSETMRNYFE